jgi:hypothetical protein
MVQKWIRELPEKTGRSLDEWIRLVKEAGPPTQKERRDWLKREHGFGPTPLGGLRNGRREARWGSWKTTPKAT